MDESENLCKPVYPLMRKSVENLLIASHDVIGIGITSSLSVGAMTLPSNCHISSPNRPVEPRSSSPNVSPQSSPRPSPQQHHKHDHTKSDCVKNDKTDPFEDNISRSSDSSQFAEQTKSTTQEAIKERKESRSSERGKKKFPWYNAIYPNYKSRSEDFKRFFNDVPADERLIVDYSCALQKDILLQGRLYVTQNYLCFHANIFGWETQLSLKWKDVKAITKEKTARVFPNAIEVCTESERYFLTTFTSRDKTYLMLFRVWQNALMNQQMSMPVLWQWVHSSYGEELGLTSEDDDYVAPAPEEDKNCNISSNLSVESFVEMELRMTTLSEEANNRLPPNYQILHSIFAPFADQETYNLQKMEDSPSIENELDHSLSAQNIVSHAAATTTTASRSLTDIEGRSRYSAETLPTDMSDTTESDAEKKSGSRKITACTSPHEGRKLVRVILPIHIDQLFTLLFTGSKFYLDFHTYRKTTDLVLADWEQKGNQKLRTLTMTMALGQTVGPKSSNVTENQVMLECSTPGQLYAIDVESTNAGIPYADSFSVFIHYCLTSTGTNESSLTIYAMIKYRKSVWGLVKNFIEKNTWSGMEDFFNSLVKALHAECDKNGITKKKGGVRRRTGEGMDTVRPRRSRILSRRSVAEPVETPRGLSWAVLVVLLILVCINILLYYKLWVLEDWTHQSSRSFTVMDLQILKNPPKSHDEWLRLLQQQESLHNAELSKWQKILHAAIELLRQTEESLSELQLSINPIASRKILSILKETLPENSDLNVDSSGDASPTSTELPPNKFSNEL